MEAPTLRWFESFVRNTESDVVGCFPDDVIALCCTTSSDRSNGNYSADCAGCELSDDIGWAALRFGRGIPAQLLFDVSVLGDVILTSSMFSELVCGSDVHFVLAYGVVFRHRHVAGVGAEGVLDSVVCGSVHDATVPTGIHVYAPDEHEKLLVVVRVV